MKDRENKEVLAAIQSPLSRQKGSPHFLFLNGPCEGRCLFCSAKNDAESPLDRVLAALDRRVVGGTICIIGNEPLLYSRIFDILAACRSAGFSEIEIMTSGMRLAHFPVAERFCRGGATSFSIPLHAALAEVHDGITGVPGSFDLTVRGIENILKHGAKVYIHTTLIRHNFAAIPALSKFVQKRFSAPFAVLPLRPKSSGLPFLSLAVRLSEAKSLQAFGLYGFPHCVSPYDTGEVSPSLKAYFECQAFEKPGKCGQCVKQRACPGLFRDYIDIFGDDELYPMEAAVSQGL